jgi:hypothetical protein
MNELMQLALAHGMCLEFQIFDDQVEIVLMDGGSKKVLYLSYAQVYRVLRARFEVHIETLEESHETASA